MPFPKNRVEMLKAGYKPGRKDKCRGCQKEIEFWSTPAGKQLPMDLAENDEAPAITHFATCPKAAEFRKTGARP